MIQESLPYQKHSPTSKAAAKSMSVDAQSIAKAKGE